MPDSPEIPFTINDEKVIKALNNIITKAEQMDKTFETVMKNIEAKIGKTPDGPEGIKKFNKGLDVNKKKIGAVAKGVAAVGTSAALAFGAAAAGAVRLAQNNDRVIIQQEKTKKQFDDLIYTIGAKLAPIAYEFWGALGTLIDGASEKVEGLNNDGILKIAAFIRAAGIVAQDVFKNMSLDIDIVQKGFEAVGEVIKGLFTGPAGLATAAGNVAALNVEIGQLSDQKINVGAKFAGEMAKALTDLREMNESGFFNFRRQTKQAIKELEKLNKELDKMVSRFLDDAQAAELDLLNPEERIKREAEIARALVDSQLQQIQALAEKTGREIDLTEEKKAIILAINEEEIKQLRKLRDSEAEEYYEDLVKREEDAIEQRFLLKIEAARREYEQLGLSEEDFQKQRQFLFLQADIEILQNRLKFLEAGGVEALRIQEQIAQAQAEQNALGLFQVPDTDNPELLNAFDRIKQKVLDTLKISEEDADLLLGTLANAFNGFVDLQSQETQRALDENQRLIESLRKRADTVEKELDREVDLNRKGSATFITDKKRELAEIQKEEAKAQAEREKLQRKAAKQKLIQDAAAQASSLTTGVANIIAAESAKGLLGIAFALTAIIGIFAMFKRFKAEANKETRVYRGGRLKDYGFVNKRGRTDVPGRGRGHRVEDSNLVLGGAEFVSSEDISRENERFLSNLNNKRYKGIDLLELAENAVDLKNMNRHHSGRSRTLSKAEKNRQEMLYASAVNNALKTHLNGLIQYYDSQEKIHPLKEDDVGYIKDDGNGRIDIIKFKK